MAAAVSYFDDYLDFLTELMTSGLVQAVGADYVGKAPTKLSDVTKRDVKSKLIRMLEELVSKHPGQFNGLNVARLRDDLTHGRAPRIMLLKEVPRDRRADWNDFCHYLENFKVDLARDGDAALHEKTGRGRRKPRETAKVKELTATKDFPDNYSEDVLHVLKLMSFTSLKGLKLLGSMSMRSQQYAGDYDAYEVIEVKGRRETALRGLAKRFQAMIRKLEAERLLYVGDIKAGVVKEWEVIPEEAKIVSGKIVGFDHSASAAKLKELRQKKVITEQEYGASMKLLKRNPTPEEFLQLKKEIRYNVVRWTPAQVEKGEQTYRGKVIKLWEAFGQPAITKMDTVAMVQNSRFTDFSVIYEFKLDGTTLNLGMGSIEDLKVSLRENILAYWLKGNYFKAAKRILALAKVLGDNKTIETLVPLFNSDLGRLYMIASDVGTLLYLLDNEGRLPLDRIQYEMDGFKARLGNVYTLPKFLQEEDDILERLDKLAKVKDTDTGRKRMKETLTWLDEQIGELLSFYSKRYLAANDLDLLPKAYKA